MLRFVATLLLVSCWSAATIWAAVPPPVAREFRGAWIATVTNIDWPSKPGLPIEDQKRELLKLLDLAVDLNLNAVVLQVRPACDALYTSQLEPWSPFLSGSMGQPPQPYYDPLKFAVDEAHRRGLELHAWFNPYRASHPAMQGPISADHISRTHPELVRQYGEYLWLDPGEPGAVDHSVAVIMDVVRRYDVDAVHFDDYFYPYPIADQDGKPLDFPDDASWARYLAGLDGQPPLARDDWRRANVTRFLEQLGAEIHRAKPWVKFGVSPFGIYRPGQPAGIQGFDSYAKLYADSRKWLADGVVDYLSPQLYWPIEQEAQSYPVLLAWWHDQNAQGRNLWPGNFTSRVDDGSKTDWEADEVIRQIEATRAQPGAGGNIHFSIKALAADRGGVATKLKAGVYNEPALVPASPWLSARTPAPGRSTLHWRHQNGEPTLTMELVDGEPWLWVVHEMSPGGWTTRIMPGHTESLANVAGDVVVFAVNRVGVAGPATRAESPAQN